MCNALAQTLHSSFSLHVCSYSSWLINGPPVFVFAVISHVYVSAVPAAGVSARHASGSSSTVKRVQCNGFNFQRMLNFHSCVII
jgi:hypothetical protein